LTNPTDFTLLNPRFCDYVLGRKPSEGIDAYLGITVTEVQPGRLVAEFDARPELITEMGSMHGACVSALCDHALGMVVYPVVAPRSWVATTEFKLNFLAPVTGGTCVATAVVVSLRSKLAVAQIEVVNQSRTVALGQGTLSILPPKPEKPKASAQ
jgi:1,4-dihydroxy-2-naphthoyl-CoA hydrolase